jgi:hypothetical protein
MTMLTPDSKITVELTARDALRAMILLGRANGTTGTHGYFALRQILDPQGKYNNRARHVHDELGTIQYGPIQQRVEALFFTQQHEEQELRNAYAEMVTIQNKIVELESKVGVLK